MMNPDLHLVLRDDCAQTQRLQGLLDEIEALVLERSGGTELPDGRCILLDVPRPAAPAGAKLMHLEFGEGEEKRIFTIRRRAEESSPARGEPAAASAARPAKRPGRWSQEEARVFGAGLEAAGNMIGKILGGNLRLGPGFMEHFNTTADAISEAISTVGVGAWQRASGAYESRSFRHCLLVAGYSAAFADALRFSPRDRKLLVVAALFHDIGKSEIPVKIRDKVGRLDRGEMVLVRTHPQRGYRILVDTPGLPADVLDVVHHHHEFLDGSGYPEQLRGSQIGDLVRLTTIASTFAGLVESAGLQEPTASGGAYRRLQEMDTKLDSILVQAFGQVAHASAA